MNVKNHWRCCTRRFFFVKVQVALKRAIATLRWWRCRTVAPGAADCSGPINLKNEP